VALVTATWNWSLNSLSPGDLLAPFIDKSITDTNVSETTSNQFNPNITYLAVGEIVTYTITIVVPEGTMPLNVTVAVPTGMQILGSEVLSIGDSIQRSLLGEGDTGTITSPTTLEFEFGKIQNVPDNVVNDGDRIALEVEAQVMNKAVNQAGRLLTNTGTASYGSCGPQVATADAEVVEPNLEIVKEVVGDDTLDASPPPPATPDPTVTYRVTVRHDLSDPDPSTAIAFNIEITDTLPDSLELLGGANCVRAGIPVESASTATRSGA
jgi:fimbrial isopeptide formation D2 family protein